MKKLAAIAVALTLLGCSESPQERADRARKAFLTHDYRAAQVDLAAALASSPDDPALLELHARNALAMGDGIAADASLNRIVQTRRPADFGLLMAEAWLLRNGADEALAVLGSDASPPAQRLRALALLGKDDREGAAQAFATGAQGQADARLLADFARFSLMNGNARQARDLVNRAKAADPDLIDTRLSDAEVSTAEGRLAEALAAYDGAVKAYPGNLAALSGKAAVLGDLGRTKEMEEVLASLADVRGGAKVAYLQAQSAAGRKDWKTVRSVLQANEKALSGNDEANILYAQSLVALGQPEQARARLQPLLTRNPQSLLIRRELGKAQLASGDGAGALETLRPFSNVLTADPADLRLLARAATVSGDPNAVRLAEKARYPTPQALAATLAEADTAMRSENWANAIVAYERILAVTDGRNPLVLNNMAVAQGKVGNTRVAIEFGDKALKYAPGNASVMDTLGWLLVQSGADRKRGLALLTEAAQKAPDNATIREHLHEATKG
ncbi:MAG: tetratricopeptide repeat protein [Novosphingobium sp.]|uniref:tetratricopeptide repeat protein n=1 Tax=Novosphingobium sp. TaxID=1874826 RepID=UPI003B9C6A68